MNDNLYHALLDKGFPEEFCKTLCTQYLNTDYTSTRMLGYLYRYSAPSMEDVVDEMLAIISDRDAIVQKKVMESMQAKLNKFYDQGFHTEE